MMHLISGGAMGNVFELENHTHEVKRMHELMMTALVKETKMTKEQVAAIMDPKLDYYVTPKQALKMGIIDRIIGAE
jgi:ATP-dependent protease ClpP protease subunit